MLSDLFSHISGQYCVCKYDPKCYNLFERLKVFQIIKNRGCKIKFMSKFRKNSMLRSNYVQIKNSTNIGK